MFQELNDSLSSIEEEVGKLKTAVAHIEKSKESAETAVKVAEKLTKDFSNHLKNVTDTVDKILKPHVDLIKSTKRLKWLLITAIAIGIISITISILQMVSKFI